ncbi:hypothetical protein [Streptomyces sp. NPDC015131]
MTTELLYNGEPVDLHPLDDTDDAFEARYPFTDRAFIVTAEDIVPAADWE